MKTFLSKRWWRVVACLVVVYVALVAYRFFGGGRTQVMTSVAHNSGYFDGVSNLRKNYASEKEEAMDAIVATTSMDAQKYEKTADVTARSLDFDKDDKSIRAKTEAAKGVIQYEKAFGLKGRREVHMIIGITPERFDSFYNDIRRIGTVLSMSVVKEDRTNEYRKLNAQKASLEKTLTSLQELKSKGGEIADFVALHDKILEIESRLQELGVELGNFNSENEFCTVKFSLYEGAVARGPGVMKRIMSAMIWAGEYYFILLILLLMVSGVAYITLLAIDKAKQLQRNYRKD